MHWSLSLLACLAASAVSGSLASADGQRACRLYVTSGSIADSWQSSSYVHEYKKELCFKNPGESFKDFRYFHTNSSDSSADAGYHWFVIKLNSLADNELISAVSIRVRHTSVHPSGLASELRSRAADIEIWTSQIDADFGRDRCNSRNISAAFKAQSESESGLWTYCGSTPSNVSSGEVLTVPCVRRKVRVVLLRKDVRHIGATKAKFMSFTNMWIQKVNVTVNIKPENVVLRGSNVTVQCVATCQSDSLPPTTTNLSLAKDKRPLSTIGKRIGNQVETSFHFRADRHDTGIYTCSADDAVAGSQNLTVWYPPDQARLDAVCSPNSIRGNFSFLFETSQSNPPRPLHECRMLDSRGNRIQISRLEEPSDREAAVTSVWSCGNCSANQIYGVSCAAVWHNGTDASWKVLKAGNISCSGVAYQLLSLQAVATAALLLCALMLATVAAVIAAARRRAAAKRRRRAAGREAIGYWEGQDDTGDHGTFQRRRTIYVID